MYGRWRVWWKSGRRRMRVLGEAQMGCILQGTWSQAGWSGRDWGWGRSLSTSSGSGEGSRQHSKAISLVTLYFPFRNTMCNIRGNKQTQGANHRPPGEDSPLSEETQREEQPSPPGPGAPGELCPGPSCLQRLSWCPLSSPKPASLLLCQRRNDPDQSSWASMGLAAVTILFFFLIEFI